MSRDDLVPYLLHQVSEEQRAAIGERLIADPDVHEQLRMAEAELLDAYARGELSAEERSRVEQYLLSGDRQRHKLAFAEALAERLPRATASRRIGWTGLAAAAAIVLSVTGAVWFGQQARTLRREMESIRSQPSLGAGSLVAAFAPVDAVRGEQRDHRIVVPGGVEIVRVELELEPGDERGTYAAVVSRSGQVVWSEEPVRPVARGAAFVAPVWMPAGVLTPGGYEIRLAARGKAVAYYHVIIANR